MCWNGGPQAHPTGECQKSPKKHTSLGAAAEAGYLTPWNRY